MIDNVRVEDIKEAVRNRPRIGADAVGNDIR